LSAGLDSAATGDSAQENCAESGSAVDVGQFDVLICLQNLRDQIGDWRNGTAANPDGGEVDEILWTLRGLAIAARTTGFNAYGCICLHLAEQIEDLHRDGRWSIHALMTLIAQLNCAKWSSPLCQVEEDTLYRALLNPFIDPSSR
jgi:hypothetical protein